jgi:hypothetical protein
MDDEGAPGAERRVTEVATVDTAALRLRRILVAIPVLALSPVASVPPVRMTASRKRHAAERRRSR